eukprot:758864-Hanusia_phi.AAC.1
MYKEYREKGWGGLGGGIDASSSAGNDCMPERPERPERLYASTPHKSTKQDLFTSHHLLPDAQWSSQDREDRGLAGGMDKSRKMFQSVSQVPERESWLHGKDFLAKSDQIHETSERHQSLESNTTFHPPPEKVTCPMSSSETHSDSQQHFNEILFSSSGRLLRDLQPQRYSGLVESESDEDSPERHGEMEVKASSPLMLDDPDMVDPLLHLAEQDVLERTRVKHHDGASPKKDLYIQERIRTLQSLMQQDLTSRLMSQAAKREKVRQLQEERDFYLDKLERISRLCQQYPRFDSIPSLSGPLIVCTARSRPVRSIVFSPPTCYVFMKSDPSFCKP